MKERFDRSKPHVNIGTIGGVDESKITLSRALLQVLKVEDSKVLLIDDFNIDIRDKELIKEAGQRLADIMRIDIEEAIKALITLNEATQERAEPIGDILSKCREIKMIADDLDNSLEQNDFINKKINKRKPKWQR